MNFAFIDEKFIRQTSTYLNRFREVGNGTYNCRCPYCGDSQKSEIKARGYFYTTDRGIWRYKCHNCAINVSIPSFLKYLAPSLYSEYTFEYFREKDGDKPKFVKREKKKEVEKLSAEDFKYKKITNHILNEIISLRKVGDENLGVKYLKDRKIPLDRMNQLYYAESLKDVVKHIPGYDIDRVPDISGIILPYFNNNILESFQIRNIDSKSNMRYLTYDIISNPSHIFNLENINSIDRVFVFEGAFDSMFCENAVAASGSSIMQKLERIKEINDDVVVVFDNDYKTNKDIYHLLLQIINAGYKVVLFDSEMQGFKDINQFASNKNKTTTEITEYMNKCTKSGIDAKLILASHKRTRGSIKWANETTSTPKAKQWKTNNDSLKVGRRNSLFKI